MGSPPTTRCPSADMSVRTFTGPAMPAFLLSATASLAAADATGADWSVSALAQSSRYAAVEHFDSGAIADEESGRLRGHEVRLGRSDAGLGWSVRWQRRRDRVDYRGSSQIGLPVTT